MKNLNEAEIAEAVTEFTRLTKLLIHNDALHSGLAALGNEDLECVIEVVDEFSNDDFEDIEDSEDE